MYNTFCQSCIIYIFTFPRLHFYILVCSMYETCVEYIFRKNKNVVESDIHCRFLDAHHIIPVDDRSITYLCALCVKALSMIPFRMDI